MLNIMRKSIGFVVQKCGKRGFTTVAESEGTIVKTFEEENGWKIFNKKMSKTTKIVLGAYSLAALGTFSIQSYNDGKHELLEYRNSDKYKIDMARLSHINFCEWDVVKEGCSKHIFYNFYKSIVFPFTIASNTIPYIVLRMNSTSKISEPLKKITNQSIDQSHDKNTFRGVFTNMKTDLPNEIILSNIQDNVTDLPNTSDKPNL